LTPREIAIVEAVITRMSPEMRGRWLAELSALSIDHAVDFVRYMIPKSTQKMPANVAKTSSSGKNG
jgi:hypothetical protein